MRVTGVVVLVLFIMVMFLWLLALLGAADNPGLAHASPWLPWFACLLLGIGIGGYGYGYYGRS
jgi:uncharacterized membrane protein